MFSVAMHRSSQKPLTIPLCGDMVVAMSLMMGSRASANKVIDRGQPCLTPEVNRRVRQRVPLMKTVCRLSWYSRCMARM